MNIKELIKKFVDKGYEALEDSEKELLRDNTSLMEKEVASKFAEAEKDLGELGDLDEEGLKTLIAEGVKENLGGDNKALVEKLSDQLVAKFLSGVKTNRAKVIDAGENKEVITDEKKKDNITRGFLKALVHDDKTALKTMHEKATTFNQGGDDARGGYLVPEELMAGILRIAQTGYGVARREFRYLPFSGPGNERKIPTLASSVTVYWVDEAASKSSSNPTFGLVTQTLKKLAAIIPFSEEIMEDAAINITQLIAELFAEAITKEEDAQFLYGTGSPWTGILNNGSVNSVALGTGLGVSSVSFEKLVDMQDETPAGALAGAKYYMHRTIVSYLRKLRTDAVSASDGAGAFLLPPTKSSIEDILGYPIELSEAFPSKTLTGASKPFVVFGNLKLACILGDKQQIRAKLLDQATITDGDGTTTINLAEQDMLALRLEERVGYILAIPSAITVLTTGAAS